MNENGDKENILLYYRGFSEPQINWQVTLSVHVPPYRRGLSLIDPSTKPHLSVSPLRTSDRRLSFIELSVGLVGMRGNPPCLCRLWVVSRTHPARTIRRRVFESHQSWVKLVRVFPVETRSRKWSTVSRRSPSMSMARLAFKTKGVTRSSLIVRSIRRDSLQASWAASIV